MRKRKQRHRPYAGGDRPGKPSRIAFWDNIFYWLWHYMARCGRYAFRAGGIIALIQFIYCLLAIAIAINCLDEEAAWTFYLHEKGKGIAGGLVILLLPALMIIHSYIYKESRYEKLKSRFGQMEDSERQPWPGMPRTGCSAASAGSSCCRDREAKRKSHSQGKNSIS